MRENARQRKTDAFFKATLLNTNIVHSHQEFSVFFSQHASEGFIGKCRHDLSGTCELARVTVWMTGEYFVPAWRCT